MAIETTYPKLRDNLSSVLDKVIDDAEVVIVRRRGGRDVAILPAKDLSSLMETRYLLSSRKNAERLTKALERARKGEGKVMSMEELREEVGLAPKR